MSVTLASLDFTVEMCSTDFKALKNNLILVIYLFSSPIVMFMLDNAALFSLEVLTKGHADSKNA